MNIYKSLNGNKDQYVLDKFSRENKRLQNLKILADEMVKILVEKKKKEEDRLNDDTIFYDVDLVSLKHKSQVFINRNHNQLLNNFSLNRTSLENFKAKNAINRRKNKQITAQNTVNYSKNKISFQLSFKNNTVWNDNNEEEKKSNENKGKFNLDSGEENKPSKRSIVDNKEKNLDQEYLFVYDSDKFNEDNESSEESEVIYMNPAEIDPQDFEELSTKNLVNKKNNIIVKGKKKNKGAYLYEKGIKMLDLKNNKINKAKETQENETKAFFDIRNFINSTTPKYQQKQEKQRPKKYIPLQYKAGELYKFHLAKMEINKRNNIIKKEKKEREEMKKVPKINKKRLSERKWNDFINRENEWKKKNIIKKESLNKKNNDNIYDRPKINKKSIIMLEQKNENNKYNKNDGFNKIFNYSITADKHSNIYTKLYEDKKIYDNKLKLRIDNSTPTFSPKIFEKNKNSKSMKSLNNIYFIKKDNHNNKSIDNKQKINYLSPTKSIDNKRIKKIEYENKKISKKKNISLNDTSFNPRLISSKTTKIANQKYKNNKNNTNTNTNINNNSKKMYVYELNINNSNFNKKINKPKLNSIDINSFITKLGKNASKIFSSNRTDINHKNSNEKNLSKNKTENNYEINNKTKLIHSRNNSNNSFDMINKNFESKNTRKKKKNLQINDFGNVLYNLNVRDNTSNSIKQNVVLTSKKYFDFFK